MLSHPLFAILLLLLAVINSNLANEDETVKRILEGNFDEPHGDGSDASPAESQQPVVFTREQLRYMAEARVEEINRSQNKWTAKVNPRFAEMRPEEFRYLLGVRSEEEPSPLETENSNWKPTGVEEASIPDSFDARQQWPECADVIAEIQDQSACGSCWAVSSASVMQDRICISSGGKQRVNVSSIDIASCDRSCYGCLGGWPHQAFRYWQQQGICTGSNFTLSQGCKPYPFPPHPKKFYMEPRCKHRCTNAKYNSHIYSQDKSFGTAPVTLKNATEEQIKTALLAGGPVVTCFAVYDDFMHYHRGVYVRGNGSQQLGLHAVRLIGWGVETGGADADEQQTPYWLIANSWNADWGSNGYFKIARGQDECGIETMGVSFGQPDWAKSAAP